MSIFCKVSHQKKSFKSVMVLLTLEWQKTGGMDLLQDLGTNRGGHELTLWGELNCGPAQSAEPV